METNRDYTQDIAEIRSMMERSSKFLSLSGWSGALAGLYALVASYIAYNVYGFNPDTIAYNATGAGTLSNIIILAVFTLALAMGTATLLSYRKANKKGENAWNATSRRLLSSMAVPLAAGGILLIILLSKGLLGLLAPLSLLFYGLALFSASKFTYNDLKFLGIIQIALGLLGSWFIEYGLLLWAIGFGFVHIAYGIYMHLRYER